MVNLYKVNIDWYDDYTDEDHKDEDCLVFAENIAEVAARMNDNFKYINFIKITELCVDVQDGVLWLPTPMTNLSEIIEANTY